ncbi:MAG: AMP-binding protein, partial [Burkholderiales bacterium]
MWGLTLGRYCGEREVVFGTIVSGRPAALAGVESMVGLFINTLPMRVSAGANTPILRWLGELQRHHAEMRQYEFTSLVDVQGWTGVPRGVPLFESILAFENHPGGGPLLERASAGAGPSAQMFEQTNYPLAVLAGTGPELWLEITYDAERFERETIRRLLAYFETLTGALVADPGRRLGELPAVTPEDRRQALAEWNATAADYPDRECIHDLFEAQAARTPDAPAVEQEGERWTFAELSARSHQLAHHLRTLGVGPESRVAISLPRAPATIAAMLAVMKAGGAYVPIDPSYPLERRAFMLADSGAAVLLSEQNLIRDLHPIAATVVLLDRDRTSIARCPATSLDSGITPDNAAFVIYTSGSTGRPKGVVGVHRGAVNRFAWMWRTFPFAPGERGCHRTALS